MTLEELSSTIRETLLSTTDYDPYAEGYQDAIFWVCDLLDQLEPSWHPFPEEKPPVDSDVIVQWDDMTMEVDHYTGRGFSWFSELENQPVAWADLPKPYVKESDNDH